MRPCPASARSNATQLGFSLVEMTIALAVLGIVLTGLIGPLQQFTNHQRQRDTREALASIRQALLGFAMSQGRLPCPADPAKPISLASAGLAEPDDGSACLRQVGSLPWKTLGGSSTDAWFRRYTYAVAARYSQAITVLAYPLPSSASDLAAPAWYVYLSAQTPPPANPAQLDRVAALVVSHGANGHGAWHHDGVQQDSAQASSQELLNLASAGRTLGSNASPLPFYLPARPGADSDDVQDSLPAPLVLHALVSAGRLP